MDKTALTVIGISVLIGLSPFIVEETSVNKDENVLYSNVTVVNEETVNGTLGLGVTTVKKLDFGEMPTTVEYTRKLNVSAPAMTLLTISVDGNISEIMKYERKHYFQGDREIELTLNSSRPGHYDGNVTVKTLTAENEIGERWLYVKSGEFLPSFY